MKLATVLQYGRCLSKYVTTSTARRWQSGLCSAYRLVGSGACQRSGLNGFCQYSPLHVSASSRFAPVRGFHLSSCAFDEKIIEVEGPTFPESISEGDIRWTKKKGDYVKEDDVVAEIETDKTNIEVPVSSAGIIEELLVPDGAKVTSHQVIYKLKLTDKPPPSAKEEAKPAPAKVEAPGTPSVKKPAPASVPPPGRSVLPPLKPAIGLTAPPLQLTGAHPSPAHVEPLPTAAAAASVAAAMHPQITGERTETRVKMSRMRTRITKRLTEAQGTYVMLTTFNEVDMSGLFNMRNKFKDAFLKKHGIKLGFMSPFVKAAAYVLQEQPVVNAVIDGDEIVYRSFVDISVAVATPKGLVVPVLRNVERMSCADIELAIHNYGELAKASKLAIEDMEGGTFTISNGGVFGSLFSTPVINPPQSAILGMHAVNDRPVVVDGKIEIRPMMYVALTYDHRLIDGREAVTFLRKLKFIIEDPRMMLLNL